MSNIKYFVIYFDVHPNAPQKKFIESNSDYLFLTKDRPYLISDYFDSIEECHSFIDSLSHFNYPLSIFIKIV